MGPGPALALTGAATSMYERSSASAERTDLVPEYQCELRVKRKMSVQFAKGYFMFACTYVRLRPNLVLVSCSAVHFASGKKVLG